MINIQQTCLHQSPSHRPDFKVLPSCTCRSIIWRKICFLHPHWQQYHSIDTQQGKHPPLHRNRLPPKESFNWIILERIWSKYSVIRRGNIQPLILLIPLIPPGWFQSFSSPRNQQVQGWSTEYAPAEFSTNLATWMTRWREWWTVPEELETYNIWR